MLLESRAVLMGGAHASLVMKVLTAVCVKKALPRQKMANVQVCYLCSRCSSVRYN